MNSKWRNYSLYVSIAAAIPLILKGFNINILPTNYNDIVNAVLSVLVMAGIISNPSIGSGFIDTVANTSNITDITNDMKTVQPNTAAQETTITTDNK